MGLQFSYNWDIANDTYVPLPCDEGTYNVMLWYWTKDMREYYFWYNYYPYWVDMRIGHC